MVSRFQALARILALIVAGMLIPWTSYAGSKHLVFVPDDGLLNTTNDDLARAIQLTRDYEGVDNSFWLVRTDPFSNDMFIPILNLNGITSDQVRQSVFRALTTWNNAKYSNFQFPTAAGWADQRPLFFLGEGDTGQRLVAIDGINLISFIDPSAFPDATQVGVTIVTYFYRDFDLQEFLGSGSEVPFSVIAEDGSFNGAPALIMFDLDADSNFDMQIPYRDYKAGDIIDTDITINPAAIPFLQAWPENQSDVPPDKQDDVLGSLDVQAILMHELGWAQGLGNSGIVKSAMYPFFEPNDGTAQFPTDPYEKRGLSLDDEITAGLVHDGDYGSGTATILGTVIEGSTFNLGAATIDIPDGGALPVDAYVTQVPIGIGVRVSAGTDPTLLGPDEIVSLPGVADENAGTYRLLAMTVTGENLSVIASPFLAQNVFDDIFDEIVNPNDPGAQPGGSGVGPTVLPVMGNVDSHFRLPGLPVWDDQGTTISYALFLGVALNPGYLNPVQSYFQTNAGEAFPDEFYGGPITPVTTGNGTATDRNIVGDQFFENNYITAEVDNAGRIAASINPDPIILSGYNAGPRSWVEVKSGQGTFTNRFSAIGAVQAALQIDEAANTAQAQWIREGDFRFDLRMHITDQAGIVGIPAGLQVDYTVKNMSSETQTFNFRQVLDTFLWGNENPVYKVNGLILPQAISYSGAAIPTEVVYQNSESEPAFECFLDVRSTSLLPPSVLTIAPLSKLHQTIAPGSGETILGPSATNLDTGISVSWNDITLVAGEARVFTFVLGILPGGEIFDTATPPADPAAPTGFEDDPQRIKPLKLKDGELKDGVTIITNTGAAVAGVPIVPPGSAAGLPQFVAVRDGFPPSDAITAHVVMGDIDNDGDLDVIAANIGGGTDPFTNSINRIYRNEFRVNPDGSITHFYRDATYGDDGTANTPDDRMPIVAESTTGLTLADLDGDNDLDMVICSSGLPMRVLRNMGPDPARLGFFEDISAQVLPGFLNLGWGVFAADIGVAAADIDSDGDLDLIVSQGNGQIDLFASQGWVDASREDPQQGGNPNANRLDSQNDFFSGALFFTERVLINHINEPTYAANVYQDPSILRGFYFTEETLGADDRFGTMTSLEVTRDGTVFDRQTVVSWNPAELDRMPPVFPAMVQVNDQGQITGQDSPMAANAVRPIFGPITGYSHLGLVSLRPGGLTITAPLPIPNAVRQFPEGFEAPDGLEFFIGGETTPGPANAWPSFGSQNGYFENVDILSLIDGSFTPDGVPDGYFMCINFGATYSPAPAPLPTNLLMPPLGVGNPETLTPANQGTAGGLFVIEPDLDPTFPLVTPNAARYRFDANSLFIGVPPASLVGDPGRGARAGVIGDWENQGAPRPLVAAANGAMYTFDMGTSGFDGFLRGTPQGDVNIITGVANPYWRVPAGPYVVPDAMNSVDVAPYTAVPFGIAAGDFDNDGDTDFVVVTGTVEGGTEIDGTPSINRVFLNDSYGVFTEFVGALNPNNLGVTTAVAAGDVDNDGDIDLVVFKAQEPPLLYENRLYRSAPDSFDQTDPTIFYEATAVVIPPIGDVALDPEIGFDSGNSGIGIRSVTADFNRDGRPDVAVAQGGAFTSFGDFPMLYLNKGKSNADAVPILQPIGASFPASRIDAWDHLALATNAFFGAIGEQRFNVDIDAGDFDGDGAPDLLILNNAALPMVLLNTDADALSINSAPDPDGRADGVFEFGVTPLIEDPDTAGGDVVLKLSGRALASADLNRDGTLDVIIANGLAVGGAPNVILMNIGGGVFNDSTELRLPLAAGTAHGVRDNSRDVVAADFTHDGFPDLVFANASNSSTPMGFRLLVNDGTGNFRYAGSEDPLPVVGGGPLSDAGRRMPQLTSRQPYKMVVADFDGVGEWSEDRNGNGFLDPDEDDNNNGQLDPPIDRPTETEDLNGNGVLDPGEDVGIVGPGGALMGAGNGQIDTLDRNNDGFITVYRTGVAEQSLDIFVTFEDGSISLLINDPTNVRPGTFTDEASLRFESIRGSFPLRGCDVGDINLDGMPDLVAAEFVGGVTRPAKLWLNEIRTLSGNVRKGFFRDASHEIPYARAVRYLSSDAFPPGPNNAALSGFSTDISLMDLDNDGDLDFYVVTGGKTESFLIVGNPDFFYMNRIIGDGWNFRSRGQVRTPGNPIVHAANPAGASRASEVRVQLAGENFMPSSQFSFGQGIAVERIDYLNPSRADVIIEVAADAVLGPRSIVVQNPTGGATQTKVGVFAVVDVGVIVHQSDVSDGSWTIYR